jgi:3-oxo-5-alpha-steroid 4-dehydrogenase
MAYVNESRVENAGYSKFFSDDKALGSLPSRLGMLVLYSPAFFLSCYMSGQLLSENGTNFTGDLTALLFGKRLCEVSFVHRYSGRLGIVNFVMPASLYYMLSAYVATAYSDPAPLNSPTSIVGVGLFAIGLAGNLYHHILLRNLRSSAGEKKYVVPRGGLFEYVACPHYLFEVVSWLGIGVYGRAVIGYAVAWGFSGYLMGRSISTTAYYLAKLGEEYPKTRKHMIPFIF